jgi:sugar fermentation stimulation protein A
MGAKPDDQGLYLLVIRLGEPIVLKAGKLPPTLLQPGTYLYIGRAKKKLRARVARHLQDQKKIFWHVDYLLQHASIEAVGFRFDDLDECGTAQSLQAQLPGCLIPFPRFGASDCRCGGHLLYLPQETVETAKLGATFSFKKEAR